MSNRSNCLKCLIFRGFQTLPAPPPPPSPEKYIKSFFRSVQVLHSSPTTLIGKLHYKHFPGTFPRYFRTLLKNILLGACFVEVGFSGRQTFNIREKAAAIQRALFEHLFLCDHYQDRVCSVVFMKKSSNTYVFLDVFQSFIAAISKCSHEKVYFFPVF